MSDPSQTEEQSGGMTEKHSKSLEEREKKSYITGLLCEIVKEETDIVEMTDLILEVCQICKGEELQKTVLGEIWGCLKDRASQAQAVAVSKKIAARLSR